MEIKEIYKLNYMSTYWTYIGTLRNDRKFNLGDKIFFVAKVNEIFRGEIVGIELLPNENPEYKYKIKLPRELMNQRNDSLTLTCNEMFATVEEAKESAIKQLDHLYNLQKQEIERYFNQWSDKRH